MPGPKTHEISYRHLRDRLDKNTLNEFPNYDEYSIFAQGHDFLIYYDYYKIWNQRKLDINVHNSILLQEWSFQEFIYNYLDAARGSGAIENEQVRLFIGPGYIMHHILDSYTHPQIIYYAGDHERDPNNKTWQHGIIENLIDVYMIEQFEKKNPKKYKVYRDFKINKNDIDEKIITTLNESLEKTYAMSRGGEVFKKAIPQVESYMKHFKYDRTGIKRIIFDYFDSKLVGTSSFSYHRDSKEVLKYLNLEKDEWLNPMDCNIKSNKSFLELYDDALNKGSEIINKLEKLCQKSTFNKDDVYDIIPNVASTHGLECGQRCKIKNKKIW